MVDRPILFSAPMVRAIIAGRKTQTRRIITSARTFRLPCAPAMTLRSADLERALQGASDFLSLGENMWTWQADAFEWQAPATRTTWNAYIGHAVGDRLWVREAWRAWWEYNDTPPSQIPSGADVQYVADEPISPWETRYRPGMFMPRWASRISLLVTDVRVQRLQDISEDDAIAEGIEEVRGIVGASGAGGIHHEISGYRYYAGVEEIDGEGFETAVVAYAALWDHINGAGAWAANPWVAAYTFERDESRG